MSRKKQAKAETSIAYVVPGEVAMALTTGRSQLINGLVGRIRKGEVLHASQVIGLLELIRDWVDVRYADDRRNAIVKESLAASMSHVKELQALLSGLEKSVTEANLLALRHGSGPLGPEDDLE